MQAAVIVFRGSNRERDAAAALAAFGAALNLFVIWHVRRLRGRPAAQWRIAPLSASKVRSERIQIVLAVLTFACLAAEWITHPMMHHPH